MQALRSTARPAIVPLARAVLSSPSPLFPLSRQFPIARSYATGQDAHTELQAKQLKLVEKAGRMKQNMGAQMSQVPIFANHIPPAGGRKLPADAGFGLRLQYFVHDRKHWGHSAWTRMGWKKLLGSDWYAQFKDRALISYREMNQSLATGNYETLRNYASFAVIDTIKGQRTRKLQGLRMSWKLHNVTEQTVVCARQQEIFKKDENVGQMVVRFVTEQSLEIRDPSGRLVGNGSHSQPERVTEYCVFQRDMWRPDDDWKCVRKGARETDTLADPSAQP
ncbi:hypothetical protein JCM11641_006849 [Rhodosporidiobolus odoratus]